MKPGTMSQALGNWLKKSPVMLPMYTPSPSGKNLIVHSKIKKLVWYSKLFYLAVIIMVMAFFMSTMVVNDQRLKKAVMDTLSRSFPVNVRSVSVSPVNASGLSTSPQVNVSGVSTPPVNVRSVSVSPVNASGLSTSPQVNVSGVSTPQVNMSGLSALHVNVSEEACYKTKAHCSRGGEDLPKGIIVETTDLQLRSLALEREDKVQEAMRKNLLAMAVGIKQKKDVDDIVKKFPLSNFTIMLFHYDGVVEQWLDLSWSNQSIHIVGLYQTKWWFAKRFMHPDVVAQYNYVFLWDEDLGVEHFHADKYLEIMEEEGFEISQPALDSASSEIHHALTRRRASGRAHTMVMASNDPTKCNKDSNAPPCTGYVEVMAPVFSKAAWRCIWYMIQNDLVHGWGIDFKIGYCAQGVRSKKVGVIDAEYVLHKSIPSLGGPRPQNVTTRDQKLEYKRSLRSKVRNRSREEMTAFLLRWKQAVEEDASWKDPYPPRNDSSAHYHTV